MESPPDKTGFVVNYYWRSGFSASVRQATLLALALLRENSGVGKIVLMDGSPIADKLIKNDCHETGIIYHHAGQELSFASGFNCGKQLLDEPYIGLMANDIFPPSDTVQKLIAYLQKNDVGCVFPYLSHCDYPGQMYDFVRMPITCEPSLMTLNLNIFKREVLEQAGGVAEGYSGSYNDLILLMKIRQQGYRVVLVGDTRVTHLGQMTISQGSTYRKTKDRERFVVEYPTYATEHGAWQVAHWKWPLATNKLVGLLWWICQNTISTRLRNAFQRILIMLEPSLTRFPAGWGNAHTLKRVGEE